MIKGFKWKLIIILLVLGVSIWYAHPLEKKINLGLDLQGGMHLVLGVDAEKAVEGTVSRNLGDIKELFNQKNIQAESIIKEGNKIVIKTNVKEDEKKIKETIGAEYPSLDIKASDSRIEISMTNKEITDIKEHAVLQALETIRNRIDEFGVSEPTIQKQSESQILVQLPGIKDI